MNRKKPENQGRAKAVRGKYASAFDSGVRVVVHGEEGDRAFEVTRKKSGRLQWRATDSVPTRRRKKAS